MLSTSLELMQWLKISQQRVSQCSCTYLPQPSNSFYGKMQLAAGQATHLHRVL